MRKKISIIWHDAVGGLPSDFWILWSGILVNRIGAMAFPFLSFFLVSKGFSGNVAALAVSCWGIGGLTATFFGGWSADRIGRKPTLLAGLAFVRAGHAGYALGQFSSSDRPLRIH